MTGPSPKPRALTVRQREILLLAAAGHTGKQIARILGVRSSSTITYHLTNAYRALGAKDAAHAVALAIHHGHITLAELARIAGMETAA
ncbi:response regulator transcription factor [Streptomyces aureus]|uniref:response regulator transcription factor n=1 Tax=Streptomyces aureus TaxID=193461 RepID=UPI000690A524|nr:helix-turn-helix transcriptional regulator [Streptomyces aureus]